MNIAKCRVTLGRQVAVIAGSGLVALTLAACGSSSSSSSGEVAYDSGVGDSEAVSTDKALQAVSISYRALGTSLADFLSTPVNESDLESSTVASAAKLPQIRKDYDYFHLVLSAVSSDEQLGTGGAPSLVMLQSVDSAVAQWVAVREAYIGEISRCFGSGNNAAFADCQAPIFSQFETQLVETAKETGLAIQAVDNAGQ
jgi:hypothetical protein